MAPHSPRLRSVLGAALVLPAARERPYPIEIVVAAEARSVRVRLVNTMYRMKMFFEDAGKWAFMKNMGMPGSIQDELTAQVRAATGGGAPTGTR